MDNNIALRDSMLTDISAMDFMLIDLNLYLDTHPCDTNALALFNNVKSQADITKFQYTNTFGPLTPGSTSTQVWNWIDNPWPWENMGGRK